MRYLFKQASSEFENDLIFRHNEDGSVSAFPIDETNIDYRKYLAWVAEGNTPEPWEPES